MIIVLNFICGPCGDGEHAQCANHYLDVPETVIKSQCDCQHREKK